MNLTNKGFLDSDDAKTTPSKSTFLNPNAAEFVPSSFQRSNTSDSNIYRALPNSLSGQSKPNISSKSDEAADYWYSQLPDDITSDFSTEVESGLSFANLSLKDDAEKFAFNENYGYLGFTTESLEGQQFTSRNQETYNNDNNATEDASFNTMEFLTYQFPGFAAESLADVYYANGCDLSLTIEMLTQLELQSNVNMSETASTKSPEPPNFDVHDFPALPSESNDPSLPNKYNLSSNFFQGTTDFASTVRKRSLQEDSMNHKHSADRNLSSRRSSEVVNKSYKTKPPSASSRAAPVWLETGESVANLYSELRGDARELARVRNAYFDQARQAYIIGNGALAKELSRKGKLYNMQMKEAHEKARETIYRHRNPSSLGSGSQDQLIDLHGLHVSEAIQVLQQELTSLKRVGRSQGKRLHVMICVGTGHHTKGSRTPARLPVAVEQFLIGEGFQFTQPQPGLLRVVL